jgi:hypothetical protein
VDFNAKWPQFVDSAKVFQISEPWLDSNYGQLSAIINVSSIDLEEDTLRVGIVTYKIPGVRDTADPAQFTIDTLPPGLYETDLVFVNTTTNLIDTLKGVPDSFNATARLLADTCLLVATVNVFGSTVTVVQDSLYPVTSVPCWLKRAIKG